MAKKAPKKMKKRDFPSNKKRARLMKAANKIDLAGRMMMAGHEPITNAEVGRQAADLGTAGLVPNKAGQKMQANKKLKTPQMGRDIPLPPSK